MYCCVIKMNWNNWFFYLRHLVVWDFFYNYIIKKYQRFLIFTDIVSFNVIVYIVCVIWVLKNALGVPTFFTINMINPAFFID